MGKFVSEIVHRDIRPCSEFQLSLAVAAHGNLPSRAFLLLAALVTCLTVTSFRLSRRDSSLKVYVVKREVNPDFLTSYFPRTSRNLVFLQNWISIKDHPPFPRAHDCEYIHCRKKKNNEISPVLERPSIRLFAVLFLSRATRPISHRVGPSVRRSFGLSHFAFFFLHFWAF